MKHNMQITYAQHMYIHIDDTHICIINMQNICTCIDMIYKYILQKCKILYMYKHDINVYAVNMQNICIFMIHTCGAIGTYNTHTHTLTHTHTHTHLRCHRAQQSHHHFHTHTHTHTLSLSLTHTHLQGHNSQGSQ